MSHKEVLPDDARAKRIVTDVRRRSRHPYVAQCDSRVSVLVTHLCQ